MEFDESEIIKRVLAANGLSAERALNTLVRAMCEQHVEQAQRGGKDVVAGPNGPEWTGGDPLFALIRRLARAADEHAANFEAHAGAGKAADPSVDADDFMDGLLSADQANVQNALVELLVECEKAAEHAAGLDKEDDEDDDRPRMRLVRD